MTKSTITRERLEELAAGQSGFNLRIATLEESQQLARMALAAMDGEPVAWIAQNKNTGEVEIDEPFAKATNPKYWTDSFPVYRHAQQPVVPDDSLIAKLLAIAKEAADNADAIAYAEFSDKSMRHTTAISDWERRAAMLAAATQSPGSEPATVPGKWIPVSERMPEDRTQVILWDAEIGEVTSGHYSHKTQTFYHCGDAIENEITHWMPPPCAPQEVK